MSVAPARTDIGLAPDGSLLYERYRHRIYAFCLSRLKDPSDADDATQTTFVYAIKGLQRGVEPRFELTWLLKIAENVCHSMRRRAHRRYERDELPLDVARPDADVASTAERIESLCAAVSELPENQRRAIVLREWRGLSYDDISTELGVSRAAVETLIFRARRTLVARLRPVGVLVLDAQRLYRWVSALGGGAKTAAATVVVVGATAGSVAGVVVEPAREPVAVAARETPSAPPVVVRTRAAGDRVVPAVGRRSAAPPPRATPAHGARPTAARERRAELASGSGTDDPPALDVAPSVPVPAPGAVPEQQPVVAPVAEVVPEQQPVVAPVTEVVESVVERVAVPVLEDVPIAVPVDTPPLAPVVAEPTKPIVPVVDTAESLLPKLP